MDTSDFTITGSDGETIVGTRWSGPGPIRAIVQIAHGMGEHAARYARLAAALVDRGYVVYANDHRGHGRTAGSPDRHGDLGTAGWAGLVDDIGAVSALARSEHPGVPLVVLGHSMGSFAAQQFVLDHSAEIDGLVLSGTTAVDLAAASFDPDAPVDLTGLNAGFEPARTDYDWLSRDPAEVDRYIADPLCGFGIDAASTRSMVTGAPRLGDAGALAGIRSDLPLYLVAGSADPLNVELALLEVLEQRYRDAGLDDITTDYHPDARHEVFNETNRDEITANLVAWLQRFVA